jgi:AcrR family transcriptional regulator
MPGAAPTTPQETRSRLLHAGAAEFSRVGFEAASIRNICDAAHANVSSVKYHFGSKDELYREIWRITAVRMFEQEPMPRLNPGVDPRETLRDFMGWFMRIVLLGGSDAPCGGQMLAHETIKPTEGALEIFVQECAGPIRTELKRLVRAIVGKGLKPRATEDVVNGIIALCVTPQHSREILSRLGFPSPTTKAAVNRLAGTLADFALCGLDGFAGDPPC